MPGAAIRANRSSLHATLCASCEVELVPSGSAPSVASSVDRAPILDQAHPQVLPPCPDRLRLADNVTRHIASACPALSHHPAKVLRRACGEVSHPSPAAARAKKPMASSGRETVVADAFFFRFTVDREVYDATMGQADAVTGATGGTTTHTPAPAPAARMRRARSSASQLDQFALPPPSDATLVRSSCASPCRVGVTCLSRVRRWIVEQTAAWEQGRPASASEFLRLLQQ